MHTDKNSERINSNILTGDGEIIILLYLFLILFKITITICMFIIPPCWESRLGTPRGRGGARAGAWGLGPGPGGSLLSLSVLSSGPGTQPDAPSLQ